MTTHPRAKLGLAGRRELVRAIESAESQRAAAARFGVSPATANKWWRRWQEADEPERASLACLRDRSSRRRRSPNELAAAEQDRICEVRRRTGWGPRLIASESATRTRPSTARFSVAAAHAGRASRARRWSATSGPARETCCTWTPSAASAAQSPATRRPAVGASETAAPATSTCTRSSTTARGSPTPRCSTTSAPPPSPPLLGARSTVPRARDRRRAHPHRQRLDLHHKNRGLAEFLDRRQILHKRTRPYSPKTNGKVERYQQTLEREWEKGLAYNSSADRRAALPHWLEHYNTRRRHSGIGNRTPIERVHNVLGQDS